MKNIVLTIIFTLLTISGVNAQSDTRKAVRVTDFRLMQDVGMVEMDFNINIGNKVARNGYTLTVIPVLTNGDRSLELTPVSIESKRARLLAKRREIAAPYTYKEEYDEESVMQVTNGDVVKYSVKLPYEDWMPGSALILDGVNEGCCTAERTNLGLIADNLIRPESSFFAEEIIAVPVQLTTGEKLAQQFVFIRPIEDYDPSGELSRDGTITVFYHQAKYNIDRHYRSNNESLINILSAIREIEESSDSRIAKVVIAGYASPEGAYNFNQTLSENRAEEVKKFIADNTSLPMSTFQTYGGGVDWKGLREMVAKSNMKDRAAVLNVIDNMPVWDARTNRGRLGELMRLNGGEPYRYMYRNFFPELRNAAYITVFFDNK